MLFCFVSDSRSRRSSGILSDQMRPCKRIEPRCFHSYMYQNSYAKENSPMASLNNCMTCKIRNFCRIKSSIELYRSIEHRYRDIVQLPWCLLIDLWFLICPKTRLNGVSIEVLLQSVSADQNVTKYDDSQVQFIDRCNWRKGADESASFSSINSSRVDEVELNVYPWKILFIQNLISPMTTKTKYRNLGCLENLPSQESIKRLYDCMGDRTGSNHTWHMSDRPFLEEARWKAKHK